MYIRGGLAAARAAALRAAAARAAVVRRTVAVRTAGMTTAVQLVGWVGVMRICRLVSGRPAERE